LADDVSVVQACDRPIQAPAAAAFPERLRIVVVAAVTQLAVRAAGRDANLVLSASRAGRPPRATVTGAADAPFGSQLPQLNDSFAAVRAPGPDNVVAAVVQDVGQPDQHGWASGLTGSQRVWMLGQVGGQLLQESRRAPNGDRNGDLEHRRRLIRVQGRQCRGQLGNGRVHRGVHPRRLGG
jgi:hypothetical protein